LKTVTMLRSVLAAALGATVILVGPASSGTGGQGARTLYSRAALERSIVTEINALRTGRRLPRLVVSESLALAAKSHSRDMARSGYFAHESANGKPFGDRVRRFYRSAGYRSWRAGENLLWASPDVDARQALKMWLDSPAHRRILLTSAWREIGLSAVHTLSGPRVFGGLEVTVVTADFGARIR
jgi:uncharacterized protein YkwD